MNSIAYKETLRPDGGKPKPAVIQPKLKIGEPGDRYEQEADTVADRVMKMPVISPAPMADNYGSRVPPLQAMHSDSEEQLQMKCQECEEEQLQMKTTDSFIHRMTANPADADEEEIRMKSSLTEDEDDGDVVQMQSVVQSAPRHERIAPDTVTQPLFSSKGAGQPLASRTHAEMSSKIGADFSGVRIHTDSRAVKMNKELGAQAFTHGRDVYFNNGQYDPASPQGKHLLAHELTHTIQQGAVSTQGSDLATPPPDTSSLPDFEPVPQEKNTGTSESTEIKPTIPGSKPANGDKLIESKKEGEAVEQKAEAEEEIIETPKRPQDDPEFKKVIKHTKKVEKGQKHHQPSDNKVGEFQHAAKLPKEQQNQRDDQLGHMASMDATAQKEKQRKPFTPEGFKQLLQSNLDDLEENLPTSESSAKRFKKEKPIERVKENIAGQVKSENDKVSGPLAQQAEKEPPSSGVKAEEAVEIPDDPVGKEPKPINKAAAVPKPMHPTEISMEKESESLDDYMAENEVTEDQLARSNEPKFVEALDSKTQAQAEAADAPNQYRANENKTLRRARNAAEKEGEKGLGGMFIHREGVFDEVLKTQTSSKDSDKDKQKEIVDKLEKIYNGTKEKVTTKLESLSEKVDSKFSIEAEQAKKTFEDNVEEKLDDIYGITVVDDWLFGEDTEAIEDAFQTEKRKFIATMNGVLDDIAKLIADTLNEVLGDIEQGKKDSEDFFNTLDEEQQKLAQDAFDDFNDQYESLEETVYEKQEELAQDLARSYKENVDSLRKSFDEIKERVSAGWIGAAFNFLAGVIKTILEIKDLLLNLLSAAVEAIGAILSDPIGFLGNLISGIKQGFENFFGNIKNHIITGLIEWLTGSLGNVGIQVPENLFSLTGIFDLVTQILGLTWDYFRDKAVQLLGETTVQAMEKGFEVFKIIRDKGIMGLWEHIKEQFNDLKEMVMDAIRDMIITKVIEAGIKWIMGLMSPAGAFVKAAMMIIDIVRFFIERAAQIIDLVNAFVNGIRALANGNVKDVAAAVEKALVKSIPILIGFLASLVGVTGLTAKVQKIVDKVRKKIDRAITKVIKKAKKAFGKLMGKKKPKKGNAKKIKDDNKKGQPEQITAKDRKKHKAIATSIEEKLKGPAKEGEDFKDFYKRKKKEAGVLEDKYQPQLKKGINLDIIFKALNEDQKDDDLDIKIIIKPNNTEETFSISLADKDIEVKVVDLLSVANGGDFGIASTIEKQLRQARGFKINQDRGTKGKELVKYLRGSDKVYKIEQGLLYLPFIEEQQEAVEKLSGEVEGGSEAKIFAIERGGAALAEQIAPKGANLRLTQHVTTEKKVGKKKKKKVTTTRHKDEEARQLIASIRAEAEKAKGPIKIIVSETFVSGGSTVSIFNEVKNSGLLEKFPNLSIKFLVLKQTIHAEDDSEAALNQERNQEKIARDLDSDALDSGMGVVQIGNNMDRLQVVIAQTSYILGEDVDYQSSKAGGNSKKPIIVFNGTNEKIKMKRITPVGDATARDVITALVRGKLNYILNDMK